MNRLLVLFVTEAAMRRLPRTRVAVRVRAASLLDDIYRKMPMLRRSVRYTDVVEVLRTLFPIHKNRRRRTRVFKVRLSEAEKYLSLHRIRLRPLEHIDRTITDGDRK